MKNKQSRSKGKKLLTAFLVTVIVVMLFCSIAVLGVVAYIRTHFDTELPSDFFSFTAIGRAPQFYCYEFEDRTNRVGTAEAIGEEFFSQKSSDFLSATQIPQQLADAFIAIEDKRFYEHRGVDWYRTVAAGINYVLGFSDTFGASTITQQLVKNLTGKDEVTLHRKLQEILYALEIERNMDKSEILEWYLNIIHFSDGCDGVVAAADHYFSKAPGELTLEECAVIAAITNSPSYYNPIRNPQNNLTRRNLILSQMLAQGRISEETYLAAQDTPLQLCVRENQSKNEICSWYVDMVIEDVISDLMKTCSMSRMAAARLVQSGGLRIDTAMDVTLQEMVEEYYRTAISLPSNANGVRAQSSLILIDSRTGDILAVAGAAGKKSGNRVQNFATQTLRPPGSAIKPLTVYAPALEQGVIRWSSVYDDVPVEFGSYGRLAWPKNATGVYRGLTNIPYAVAHSTNTVAVRILQELGLENSYRFAKEKFHLDGLISDARGNDCDLAALALGQLNYGVTLRELSCAYTAFADGGVYHPWRSYYRVLDAEGRILLSASERSEIVLSQENAAVMTKLMQGVIRDGTSSAVTLGKITECAGKTGTTNKDGDRWFIGYTPDIICGVWCGYEYPEELEGKNLCTNIWNGVMMQAVRLRQGRTAFEMPSSLVKASYCKDSGKLICEACRLDPRGSREEVGYFLAGEEPTEVCDCHRLCEYDTAENGGVCHGFCPQEARTKVGLITVERHFPMQIYVSDAQYVFLGEPSEYEINQDPSQSYFSPLLQDFCGISHASYPYNRSCTLHFKATREEDWEYLLPRPFFEEE